MTIAIIDYGSGNLRSAAKAFERMSDNPVLVTSRPEDVKKADHIVLPGVGAYKDCRNGLRAVSGMEEALHEAIFDAGKPFMGICVGMQLLADIGEEFGGTEGLGWIPGRVVAIDPVGQDGENLRIPHMGWNVLENLADHPVLRDIQAGDYAYFVHSFHFLPENTESLLATTPYGHDITALIGRDNMVGAQFHPEKSQETGLKLIRNFLNWKP